MSELPSVSRVYVLDDDPDLGGSVARLLRRMGYEAEPFLDGMQLLASYEAGPAACVVTDVMMEAIDGFAFAEKLRALDPNVALVFMTAWPATSKAVDAIRVYGGIDYLEKPIDNARLRGAVAEAIEWSVAKRRGSEALAKLTKREREVFNFLVKGYSTKEVARELGLSPRTVEDHRAQISMKTQTSNLRDMVALVN